MSEHPTVEDRCRVKLQLYSGYNRMGLLTTHFIKYFDSKIGLTLEGRLFTENVIAGMLFPHELSLRTENLHLTYVNLEIRGYSVISFGSNCHVSLYIVAHGIELNSDIESHVLLPIMRKMEEEKE